MEKEITQQLTQALRETFRFQEFRPGQLEALTALMTHGRLLCIQPTGYGKSLLYQLPSILQTGVTLVISPLLALMRDQLTQLKSRFGISAASINTDQDDQENLATRQAVLMGQVRILFIAPEQLDNIERLEFLLGLPIQLLVVDEAHCISTWGHDFRPSYRQIIKLARALVSKSPDVKLLALTATANEKTQADITQQLSVSQQEILVQRESMDRPNIRLSVVPATGMAAKLAVLSHLLASLKGAGLIYCATRENTELVAEYLTGRGIKTVAYHAGIETQQKRAIQTGFIQDKYPIITATNALGMGIDKPNLRFIIHFDFPGSITAYYQEVGRCGRDGLAADGILIYDPVDSKIQNHFIDSAQPTAADFRYVLDTVAHSEVPLNLTALKRESGLHPTKLTVIVAELIEQEFLTKAMQNRTQIYQRTFKSGAPDLSRYATQFAVRNAELKAIQNYAEQSQLCLMAILREALGDHSADSCGHCSVCVGTVFQHTQDSDLAETISTWLNRRTVPITLSKKIKYALPGMSILDGKLRSKEFISFMRERGNNDQLRQAISEDMLELIKSCLNDLASRQSFHCLVPIPTRSWLVRDQLLQWLAEYLKIPVLSELLYWHEQPPVRQGELLNNDQRQHNVFGRMRVKQGIKIPKGAILLMDDYTGSGSTLNEAAAALREHGGMSNPIIPFTIAAVKWRLGKKGMI